MKRFGFIALLMLVLLTLANADIYVRKTLVGDKWYTQEISCKEYNWYRDHWFKSEYETFNDNAPYKDKKTGEMVRVFGKVHTELTILYVDKDKYPPSLQRMKLIRYYTEERF